MLRQTLTNIKKVCAFTFLPRIWRGHIVKCSPAKFQKLPNRLSSAGKGSKSSDKGDCEKCKRIIEYAFGSGQYPTSDIKGFPKLIDTELANIVSPQLPEKSKDPKKVLKKKRGTDNDQEKELADVGVIKSSTADEMVVDGIKKVPTKVDNLPASENLVLATTAKHKKDLTQKVEKKGEKQKTKENDPATEPMVVDSVIKSVEVHETMVDGIKKIPRKVDNLPATENLVLATTAKPDKEDLTQKIEKPEEPSLVEPSDNPKQDLPDSGPRILTNKLPNQLQDAVKTTNINDTTKVQTMNLFMLRSSEPKKQKRNPISASSKSKIGNPKSSVDEEKSKIGGDDRLLKEIEKFGVQPSLKSLDNKPKADTDIAEAHISTFHLKIKEIKTEAEKIASKTKTSEGNLPERVQGVDKNPIIEQNNPVNEGKKEQEWWKQQRHQTYLSFNCNDPQQKSILRGPYASSNIAKPVANTGPLSENNNEKLNNPITSKDEKLSPILLNAMKTNRTDPGNTLQQISKQIAPDTTSKIEYPKIIDVNMSEKPKTLSMSYFSSNKTKDSTTNQKPNLLELDAGIPNDPVKYSAYPFPPVPDSTTGECIKCEAVDRTNKITLIPTINNETVKAEVDVSFRYEHPIMAIETARCDPVYGCKPSYTEANPDENSTSYRDIIKKPEKLNINEVSCASQWASPEQQPSENPSHINPPWQQSGNNQPYNTPQWAAYTNSNWSKANAVWNEYPDWYEAQQQLDYARWLTQQQWYQQNYKTHADMNKSVDEQGETPPAEAPKKYDRSEIVIPPIHTTSAQCVTKMKPLNSKTETIPKVYKKDAQAKINPPKGLLSKSQVNESNKATIVKMPQNSEVYKERKLVSKPLQAILQTIKEVKESERIIRDRLNFTQSQEQLLERPYIRTKEKTKTALASDLKAQSPRLDTIKEDAITTNRPKISEPKVLDTAAQETLKSEVLEASQSTPGTYSDDHNLMAIQQSTTYPSTDDADILTKTYSPPTHEKIQCNIPATIGPLPVFKTSKDMPLSMLLKTVRLRNRLETCKAFLESIQMENPMQMGKCPSTPPNCPPKPPKCPPPDPCKKKQTPPKCPPPPVCPPPKCPPPAGPKKDPCSKCVGAGPVAIADHMPKKSLIQSLPVLVVTLNDNGLCKNAKSESGLEFLETVDDIMLARSFEPWTPIPSWPVPTKPRKKLLLCPKDGCPIQPPPKDGDFCNPKQKPCKGFPKRVTFSDTNVANISY